MARVDGWPVSITRQHGSSTRPVNSASGNRALASVFTLYTGTLELKLQSMPKAAKRSKKCTLDMLPDTGEQQSKRRRRPLKIVSLFEQKRLRGFWPCYRSNEMGQRELTVLTHYVTVYVPYHNYAPEDRFPFKRNRLRCVNENRKKRKANFTQQMQAPANRNARSKQWQPWFAACQRKHLRFLRFSFTQRTQSKQAIAFEWKPGLTMYEIMKTRQFWENCNAPTDLRVVLLLI